MSRCCGFVEKLWICGKVVDLLWICGKVVDLLWICQKAVDLLWICRKAVDWLWICCGFVVDLHNKSNKWSLSLYQPTAGLDLATWTARQSLQYETATSKLATYSKHLFVVECALALIGPNVIKFLC
jgi:hypothetical protein